jgi:integrase
MLQREKGALLQTPVTQKEIWDDKDVSIFLKYCTDNPRLRLYHALAYETSARPGELLQLKIGDIADKIGTDDNGKLYTFIDIGRYGKKKQSRMVGRYVVQHQLNEAQATGRLPMSLSTMQQKYPELYESLKSR